MLFFKYYIFYLFETQRELPSTGSLPQVKTAWSRPCQQEQELCPDFPIWVSDNMGHRSLLSQVH